jgi:outer membrane protein assembly factor BamB
MNDVNPVSSIDGTPVTSPPHSRPPRLWPAATLVAVYWVAWAIVNVFMAGTFTQFLTLFWTPMGVALGLLVWWLGFSRLPWASRLWGPACLIAGGLVALALCHKSMPFGLLMYALPVALTAVVMALLVTGGAATRAGWIGLAAASLLAWGYFTLIRFDGITGGFASERSWRWSPTPEDIFLAEQRAVGTRPTAADGKPTAADGKTAEQSTELTASEADWPAFRGTNRDGHVRPAAFRSDWSANPPRQLWKRRVGPGWSSFSVIGNRAYTQEQRGPREAIVCIDIQTGNELWSHEDEVRFEEVVAGAGPRATPTFHQGRIYALGGSGMLNCLAAASGKKIWSRDISLDAATKPPQWGFSSSPLIVGDKVIVFAGKNQLSDDTKTTGVFKNESSSAAEKPTAGTIAYDPQTGEPQWAAGEGRHGYSSAQLAKLAGVEQVLMISDYGLESFDPASGKRLWQHEWNLKDMFRVCQPTLVGDNQVLLGTGMGFGTRLIEVTQQDGRWEAVEKWTTKDLKPYFNDSVVRDGHLYGFDGALLVCIDLETGKKKWKKGRYGYGQILQVGDEGLLVVVSEQGELVLAEATPTDLKERVKFPAINGKTWNHPVIAAGKLLVRNGEEMACYDIAGTNDKSLAHSTR